MYTSSTSLLVYPMAVYSRFISLLEYPMAVHPRFGVSNGSVRTLLAYITILYPIKALSSIFLTVFIIASVPKSCLCQNEITASIPNGCVHKGYYCMIYVTAGILNSCVLPWHTQLPFTRVITEINGLRVPFVVGRLSAIKVQLELE